MLLPGLLFLGVFVSLMTQSFYYINQTWSFSSGDWRGAPDRVATLKVRMGALDALNKGIADFRVSDCCQMTLSSSTKKHFSRSLSQTSCDHDRNRNFDRAIRCTERDRVPASARVLESSEKEEGLRENSPECGNAPGFSPRRPPQIS